MKPNYLRCRLPSGQLPFRTKVSGAKINKVGKKTILSDRLKLDEDFGRKNSWDLDSKNSQWDKKKGS